MKSSIILFAVSLILIFSFQILPQETADQNSSEMEACFKTLLNGLNSDNLGSQAGCTYIIGELCCQRSVITLLKMLRDCPSEELRILAALSLYKIGDSRGIYAIKQAIKFDESKRVQRMCEIFYKAYIQGNADNTINVVLN
ncbi:MAG: HEAT repeat domain-containing protein [Ignavibacteria bacterium]|nr:HEAT repeat domain-containing protein [Ignavibacteria bacterium]